MTITANTPATDSAIGMKLGQIRGSVPGGLVVKTPEGREFVTMEPMCESLVSFSRINPRRKHRVADWVIVADYR